jgi:hypothetical protein
VHAPGGRIFNQIWHCGRVAHPEMRCGELPVGPSPMTHRSKWHADRARKSLEAWSEVSEGPTCVRASLSNAIADAIVVWAGYSVTFVVLSLEKRPIHFAATAIRSMATLPLPIVC